MKLDKTVLNSHLSAPDIDPRLTKTEKHLFTKVTELQSPDLKLVSSWMGLQRQYVKLIIQNRSIGGSQHLALLGTNSRTILGSYSHCNGGVTGHLFQQSSRMWKTETAADGQLAFAYYRVHLPEEN
uniref:Uncharacterized protein n=1 Tax=Molossus molossus TaxID=27622 RepID=A0A7J8GKD2_MOLMO|nr:hypothetical protein HJG59_011447 [Molossus molossus]